MPVEAKPGRYSSRSGWAEEEKCFRTEYREEYVPGTSKNPGYVKTVDERECKFLVRGTKICSSNYAPDYQRWRTTSQRGSS